MESPGGKQSTVAINPEITNKTAKRRHAPMDRWATHVSKFQIVVVRS